MSGKGVEGVGLVVFGIEMLHDGSGVASVGVLHGVFHGERVHARGNHHVGAIGGEARGSIADVEIARVEGDFVRRARAGEPGGGEGVVAGDVVVGCHFNGRHHPARFGDVGGARQKTQVGSLVGQREGVAAIALPVGRGYAAVSGIAQMGGTVGCGLRLCGLNGYGVISCGVFAGIINVVMLCVIATRLLASVSALLPSLSQILSPGSQ